MGGSLENSDGVLGMRGSLEGSLEDREDSGGSLGGVTVGGRGAEAAAEPVDVPVGLLHLQQGFGAAQLHQRPQLRQAAAEAPPGAGLPRAVGQVPHGAGGLRGRGQGRLGGREGDGERGHRWGYGTGLGDIVRGKGRCWGRGTQLGDSPDGVGTSLEASDKANNLGTSLRMRDIVGDVIRDERGR